MAVAEQYDQLAAVSRVMHSLPLCAYGIPYVMHALASSALLRRARRMPRRPPLPDAVADSTPDLSGLYWGISCGTPGLFAVIAIVALCHQPDRAADALVSFFRYTAVLLLIRGVTIHATLLPPCRSEVRTTTSGLAAWTVGHAYDKIFSGHAALALLSLILAGRYRMITGPCWGFLLALQCAIAFLMISAGLHYTIDVILAYLLTIALVFLLDL